MTDAFRMIVVSSTTSLLLLLGLAFYKYRFPKKKINLFILFILISLLPIISIFRTGVYESGDFAIHLYRSMAFYQSLTEGNIFPSWAGSLNAGYGYPLFIFINPLPYYLVSFFHSLGFSFIISMKLFLSMAFILSGLFMYLWIKKLYRNDLVAFTSGIFYLFTPYHLVDLHFRATVGEVTVFMTLPLVLLFLTKLIEKPTIQVLLATSTSTALLILSHQAVAVFAFLFIGLFTIFYMLLKKPTISTTICVLLSFFIGFLLAAPALIPFLTYSPYVIKGDFGLSFSQPLDFLFSPWRFGLLFQGPNGELSYLLGYTQLFIIIGSLYFLFKKRRKKLINFPHQIFWIGLLFICIFLMLPLSRFVWENVPLIKLAVMSTRLLLLYTLCISVLAGLFIFSIKKYKVLAVLLIVLTITYTMLNWGHRRLLSDITDNILLSQLPTSTAAAEGWGAAVPVQQKEIHWEKNPPNENITIINGKGEIKEIERKTTRHTYIIFAETPLKIRENTWYFPGWNAAVDNQPIPTPLLEKSPDGYLNISLKEGLHAVVVEYRDLPILKLAKNISLFLWISILIFYLNQIFLLLQKRLF